MWLKGVRRAGKTFLCQSLPDVEYFDCELPSTRRELEDPELFLRNIGERRVVLDEVHRLDNPSELLKIAADHYPKTRIVATGSSSLGASRRFRDTLTDRKRDLWLTPMLLQDEREFGERGLDHRFRCGGLPPFYLSESAPEHAFEEWIDSFWARDIQEHFRLLQRSSFLRFLELLLAVSGGIYEASRFAAQCEISRNIAGRGWCRWRAENPARAGVPERRLNHREDCYHGQQGDDHDHELEQKIVEGLELVAKLLYLPPARNGQRQPGVGDAPMQALLDRSQVSFAVQEQQQPVSTLGIEELSRER